MTNITINTKNTKNTKKRGNGMKKILAILLAIITVFAMSIPAFAADETAKDVDNTFDNYTPSFGHRAPENWYDPYCYDEDGTISFLALDSADDVTAMYCREYKRIFTVSLHNLGAVRAQPYTYLTGEYGEWGEVSRTYCPYCGKYAGEANSHCGIEPVVYGGFCSSCGEFTAQENVSSQHRDDTPDIECNYCMTDFELKDIKVYRFLTEEQRSAEYSFIFEETAYKYGDGKDGRVEDLIESGWAHRHYKEWKSEDNPNYKPTFWDKIVDFFANIIAWFQKIFGIVK